jgi:dTDP-4-dehydrorhamnose reductase
MKIWLIGSRGMLGREVERILRKEGVEFLSSDREVDIGDRDVLQAFVRDRAAPVTWMVNCSGYTAVDRAEEESELAYRVNAEGAGNLASVAKTLPASLIHISTDYVFNGRKNGPYVEEDPPDPLSVYGRSKLEGERLIRSSWQRHFIIRTAWLYGMHGANFVRTMLRLFRERRSARVVDDQWGSPTYARDLAEAIVRIVLKDRQEFGTYHYANEGKTSWYLFAREILRIERKEGRLPDQVHLEPIPTQAYPTPAQRPQNSYLSNEHIKQVLGESIRSWQEALKDFLNEQEESS